MSLKSMTGYGKGEAQQEEVTVTVEIKTVNHRYADISVRLPRTFLSHENGVRKQIGKALGRGKIDAFVNYELASGAQGVPTVNRELAASYHGLFVDLAREFDLNDQITVSHIINQKDVVQVKEAEIDEAVLGVCLGQATAMALEQLIVMRLAEGEETRKDLEERLNAAEKMLVQILKRAPQVPLEWQEKLTERLTRLQQGIE
ncbi:MAG: YicC family protein, partial [Deltaproteobacteria bacterium]